MSSAADRPEPDFRCAYRIRFSQCDPAGIVYYPQYLVLFNHLVEDWFTEGLGVDYAHMLGRRRIGLPTVRLECDFSAISRMGETLEFGLVLERAGTKSLALAVEARCGGELRAAGRQVLVFTSLDTHASIPIPDDVRAALPS